MAQQAGTVEEPARSPVGPLPLWLTVPARPGQLVGLRRALREWLAQAGVGAAEAASVQVAVGEATGNAVEHAYVGAEAGLLRLTARLGPGGRLSILVTDDGVWRRPSGHGGQRGRGFPLMRATMDEVHVHRRRGGTTVRMHVTIGRRDPAETGRPAG